MGYLFVRGFGITDELDFLCEKVRNFYHNRHTVADRRLLVSTRPY